MQMVPAVERLGGAQTSCTDRLEDGDNAARGDSSTVGNRSGRHHTCGQAPACDPAACETNVRQRCSNPERLEKLVHAKM